MEIIRGGMKAPVAMDWVTTADISGTGTGIVTSADMDIDLPENMVDWTIEIRFTLSRTGGSGLAQGWGRIQNYQGDITAAQAGGGAHFYTTMTQATDISLSKAVRLRSSVLATRTTITNDQIGINLEGRGSAADSEWSITNIMARLIYVSL
jgi:hypothetical protein